MVISSSKSSLQISKTLAPSSILIAGSSSAVLFGSLAFKTQRSMPQSRVLSWTIVESWFPYQWMIYRNTRRVGRLTSRLTTKRLSSGNTVPSMVGRWREASSNMVLLPSSFLSCNNTWEREYIGPKGAVLVFDESGN